MGKLVLFLLCLVRKMTVQHTVTSLSNSPQNLEEGPFHPVMAARAIGPSAARATQPKQA